MTAAVCFVQGEVYRRLLGEILEQARLDDEIIGVMVKGSVARGDAYPGSDLDVSMLLKEGCHRAFRSMVRHGILLECDFADVQRARAKLDKNPMQVYAYLDGRILYDPEGCLGQLVRLARTRFETYQMPADEKRAIAHWLSSARAKIEAAADAGDELRAVYLVATTSWALLEGIWSANEKPMPACGGVWAHIRDLSRGPPQVEAELQRLFHGDAGDRIGAFVGFVDWIVSALSRQIQMHAKPGEVSNNEPLCLSADRVVGRLEGWYGIR